MARITAERLTGLRAEWAEVEADRLRQERDPHVVADVPGCFILSSGLFMQPVMPDWSGWPRRIAGAWLPVLVLLYFGHSIGFRAFSKSP